jgi:hypothetical protein
MGGKADRSFFFTVAKDYIAYVLNNMLPIDAIKPYRESGGMAACILNICPRLR